MDRSQVPEYVMNTLCRICAEKSSKLTPIFTNKSLPMKICKCLPIEVNETDLLPLNVCESCFFKIDESYLLYETAYEADQKLKKLWKILVKETMVRYQEEVVLPETSSKAQCEAEAPPASNSDLILINESQVFLGLQNESNISSSNLVINIPEEISYKKVQLVNNEGSQVNEISNGVMVIGRTIALEVIGEDISQICEKRNKEAQVQVEDSQQTCKPNEKNLNETKQSTKTFQCRFCSRHLTTLSSLSIHESTHLSEKPFLCDTCGKSFKHSNNLRCHYKTHVGIKKKYICKVCSKPFQTNFFLQEHMNSHTGETPYKCSTCGKEFREKVHLRQHKWTHSSEKFICSICGSRFTRKGNMKEHIKKYHKSESLENKPKVVERKKPEEKPKNNTNLQCQVCNSEFPNAVMLKHHLKLHPEQKRYFCSMCGKKFRHSGSLTYHRRTAHTGERPFQCSYCDERFSLRSVQRIHERKKHTFERPYKCSFCSIPFTNSSSLRNHLYVHSRDKMFECDECGKKFSRSSNLLVHKKLHSGDRRFACDQCGKCYIQKHDMLKHRKVHDPKSKPFFCKYCGNSFSRKKDSSKHSMCQFEFLRKNNSDLHSAEKMLDSVASSLQKSDRAFFMDEEQLILELPEELSGNNISKEEAICQESEFLNLTGV